MNNNDKVGIFLDRDGTIIEDVHYINDPEKVVLIPKAVEGLRLLQSKGYLLFVVSNQSGLARGLITDNQFTAVHERICKLLQNEGVEIAEFEYCFHHPDDQCNCRKPKAGLIPRAFGGSRLDLKRSLTAGDSPCDLYLADSIGGRGVLVLTGKGPATLKHLREKGQEKDYQVFPDLYELGQAVPHVADINT